MMFYQNLQPIDTTTQTNDDRSVSVKDTSQYQRRNSKENTQNFKSGYIPRDERRFVQYSKNSISEDEEQNNNSKEDIQYLSKNIPESEGQNSRDNIQGQDQRMTNVSQDECPNDQDIQNGIKNIPEDDGYNSKERQSQLETMNTILQDEIPNAEDIQNRTTSIQEDEGQNDKENIQRQGQIMRNVSQDETPNVQDIQNRTKSIPDDEGQNGKENIHPQSQRMTNILQDESKNGQDIQDLTKSIQEDEGQNDKENIQRQPQIMTKVPQHETPNGQDIQKQTKSIQEEEDIQDPSKNMTGIPEGDGQNNKEKSQSQPQRMTNTSRIEFQNSQEDQTRTKNIPDRENNKEKTQSQPQKITNTSQVESPNVQDIQGRTKIISENKRKNNKDDIQRKPQRMKNTPQDELPNDQPQRTKNMPEDKTPNGQDIQKRTKSVPEDGENGKGDEVDYDELLSSAGEFGRYQVLLFISTFPFYWFGVFAYFSQLFMTEVSPNHWCWVPELENLTDVERRSLAIPPDDSPLGYSRCRQYVVSNWSEVLTHGLTNASWETRACEHGWEFNLTEIPYPTASSELLWVCDRDSYQATAQSVFFVGSIVGGFLVGWISDRYGRVPAAVSSNLIGCVAGIASAFTTTFAQFAATRFFLGMSYDNCMMMTYLLVLEYVAPKYRSLIANLPFALFFTSGLLALPWIALVCGHWRTLGLATSAPMALALLAPFVIPESPRWLLSKGRVDDAIDRVQSIGRVNKKPVPTALIDKFRNSTLKKTEQTTSSILEVLKRPLLRRLLICMCVVYMCCMIIFDSLVRSIGQLKFDFFVSFSVVSLTEFPSIILLSFILDITGRKLLTLATFSVSCLFSLLTAFVGNGLPSVLCAVAARFATNMACNTAMQWAAECLPTPVRGSGYSIVHICGYIATVISPFIVYLGVYVEWLPLVLVSLVAALGALVALGLPETAGREMPQTFEDAEEMVRGQRLLELPRKLQGRVNESFEIN